jgi:hypothetical protein
MLHGTSLFWEAANTCLTSKKTKTFTFFLSFGVLTHGQEIKHVRIFSNMLTFDGRVTRSSSLNFMRGNIYFRINSANKDWIIFVILLRSVIAKTLRFMRALISQKGDISLKIRLIFPRIHVNNPFCISWLICRFKRRFFKKKILWMITCH